LGHFSKIICFCASVWGDNKGGWVENSLFSAEGWQTKKQTGHLLVGYFCPASATYIFYSSPAFEIFRKLNWSLWNRHRFLIIFENSLQEPL